MNTTDHPRAVACIRFVRRLLGLERMPEPDHRRRVIIPTGLPASDSYALPQEAIRHLHAEAAKLEQQAMPLMSDGFLHDAYCKLEISHALRVAANYCDGTAVKLA